jgi:hypothetical protein
VQDGKSSRKERRVRIQSYRELEVWQLRMDLTEECYRVTKGFPRESVRISRMLSGLRKALETRI